MKIGFPGAFVTRRTSPADKGMSRDLSAKRARGGPGYCPTPKESFADDWFVCAWALELLDELEVAGGEEVEMPMLDEAEDSLVSVWVVGVVVTGDEYEAWVLSLDEPVDVSDEVGVDSPAAAAAAALRASIFACRFAARRSARRSIVCSISALWVS